MYGLFILIINTAIAMLLNKLLDKLQIIRVLTFCSLDTFGHYFFNIFFSKKFRVQIYSIENYNCPSANS